MTAKWTIAVWALLATCGGSGDGTSGTTSFGGAPLITSTSDAGGLAIEVRTSPQPPTRGDMRVELAIRDATSGAPSTGLAVTIVPWMPAMGHGASVVPEVSETEPGVYVASHVELFMPGTWELRTSISGRVVDHVEPSLQIP